jgi:hypothetical protein
MNVNKWTLGLAAVGLVSLPACLLADEKITLSPIETAVSSTVLSGYVDTSMHWVPGTGNGFPPAFAFNTPSKQDGFNLNAVKIALEKPLDEGKWSAGYKTEVMFGPNAALLGTLPSLSDGSGNSQLAIKQAYVNVRAPLGNGLDFKVGVFDTIIGYESTDALNNPNYTRSYGYTIEPTTHTGLLATYNLTDIIGISGGVANSYGPAVGGSGYNTLPQNLNTSTDRAWYYRAESYKTYMGSIALRAPAALGFLEGSTLYAGIINGFNGAGNTGGRQVAPTTPPAPFQAHPVYGADQTSWYVGATLNTPVAGLKIGASFDYVNIASQPLTVANAVSVGNSGYRNATALYVSYQATEKLSLHARGEYFSQADMFALNTFPFGDPNVAAGLPSKVVALTGTVQYDFWKNALTRLEFRWDHSADGRLAYGGQQDSTIGSISPLATPTRRNAFLLAANLIYKF